MSYSSISRIYDPLAKLVFGSTLLDSEAHFLRKEQDLKHLLIVGGGTGKILAVLEEMKFLGKVTYVEASLGMMRRAKARKVSFEIDYLNVKIQDAFVEESVDLVHMAYFLDQFGKNEIIAIVNSLRKQCAPTAKFIVTDFVPTPKRRHRLLVSLMYLFFRNTTSIVVNKLPAIFDVLEDSRFTIIEFKYYKNGMIKTASMSFNA